MHVAVPQPSSLPKANVHSQLALGVCYFWPPFYIADGTDIPKILRNKHRVNYGSQHTNSIRHDR